MIDFTEQESDTIRAAVMGVVVKVAKADGGFFQQFKEMAAASSTLRSLTPELQPIFQEFDLPKVTPGQEMATLAEALKIVDAKDAQAGQSLRQVVVQMAHDAAAAAGGGIAPAEQAVLDEVNQLVAQPTP